MSSPLQPRMDESIPVSEVAATSLQERDTLTERLTTKLNDLLKAENMCPTDEVSSESGPSVIRRRPSMITKKSSSSYAGSPPLGASSAYTGAPCSPFPVLPIFGTPGGSPDFDPAHPELYEHPEKFPDFSLSRRPSKSSVLFPEYLPEGHLIKSKSTSGPSGGGHFTENEDRSTAISRLKNEEAPLSLPEVRQRRQTLTETNKSIRKASINLIRRRTASRLAAIDASVLEASVREGAVDEKDIGEAGGMKEEGGY